MHLKMTHFIMPLRPVYSHTFVLKRDVKHQLTYYARNDSTIPPLTNVNSSSSCVLVNSRVELSEPETTVCGNDAPILFRYCSSGLGCSLTVTDSTTAIPESIGDGDLCRAETLVTRSTVVGGGGDGLVLDRMVCDIVRGIIDRKVLNVLR